MPNCTLLKFMVFMCFAAFVLAGCVSGRPESSSYGARAGTAVGVETDRESCIRSCNMSFERCNEMLTSTRSDVGAHPTSRPFGIKAECQDSLKACLARCRGR